MALEAEPRLPEDPYLRAVASALEASDQWGVVYDATWRIAYATSSQVEYLAPYGYRFDEMVGVHVLDWVGESFWAMNHQYCLDVGGFVLADTPGGKDELRSLANEEIRHLVDEMRPNSAPAISTKVHGLQMNDVTVAADLTFLRLRDEHGHFAGSVFFQKPGGSALTQSFMTSLLSPRAVAQIQSAFHAARRPAAILCADLDGSTPLSRRLPTANYFRLTRRMVFSADRCIVRAGGLVGRHAGDGVTAFFLAETLGSESAAASACIATARSMRFAASEVAARSDLEAGDVVMRFGLHWGSTLYVGAITTEGRFEVTALGDQVNEAARIEACASGGRALASKELVERLSAEDVRTLGLDVDQLHYDALGELSTATEKARRDAPLIAVCEI